MNPSQCASTTTSSPCLSEYRTEPHRILVVDDDIGVQNAVSAILRRSGYTVNCAGDGETGWDVLRAANFDLLITDHNMPILSGLDLLRRVRTHFADLPTIMISGDMPWDLIELTDLLPPGIALEKPFAFRELLASIRALLRHKSPAEGDGARALSHGFDGGLESQPA